MDLNVLLYECNNEKLVGNKIQCLFIYVKLVVGITGLLLHSFGNLAATGH